MRTMINNQRAKGKGKR